jgi:hypothetical protein
MEEPYILQTLSRHREHTKNSLSFPKYISHTYHNSLDKSDIIKDNDAKFFEKRKVQLQVNIKITK